MVCAKQTKEKNIGAMMPGFSFNYPGNIAPIFFILKKMLQQPVEKQRPRGTAKARRQRKVIFFANTSSHTDHIH